MEYKRILLKLSGEALGTKSDVLDKEVLTNILEQIRILINDYNVELSIVIGGGNLFRGKVSESLGMGKDTSIADYMGMMATTINAMGITAFLNNNGIDAIMQNSLKIEHISEGINKEEANNALKENKVVIFGGGTGEPYVSTDTAAAMRAIEINAEVILMAKNGVDGVYDIDPTENPNAKFIENLTFEEVIEKNLKIVDKEAMNLLKNEKIDLIVFNMKTPNNIINLYRDKQTRKTTIRGKR